MSVWPLWGIGFFLLLVRGLLAAVEAALQATSETRAKELVEVHQRRATRIVKLKQEREATAAALRFAMVLCGFTAAAIATLVPPQLLNVPLSRLPDWPLVALFSPLVSPLIVAVIASLTDVSFRAWALGSPDAWALRLSGLAAATVSSLGPVIRTLVSPLNLFLTPLKLTVTFAAPPPPLDELEKLLAARAAKNQVDKGAPQLIRSIFEMSEKSARDVMVPRINVVAVDISIPHEKLLELLAEENHSRVLVYKDDVDHVVGVLHVRDLVPLLTHPELINMHDLVRPAVFVPWVKPIGDLLREMQRRRMHLAVVVDEYGGFMGIVTLEDILREIVGDIPDEFAEESRVFERQPDGSYLVDAQVAPADFARGFDIKLGETEFETLAGLLSAQAGAIPEVGDRFSIAGWTFVVHSKDGPRIDRVRAIRPKSAPGHVAREPDMMAPRPSAPRPV